MLSLVVKLRPTIPVVLKMVTILVSLSQITQKIESCDVVLMLMLNIENVSILNERKVGSMVLYVFSNVERGQREIVKSLAH